MPFRASCLPEPYQPDAGGRLQDQDQGHTDHEIPVPGFVMENIHAQERSCGTAQDGRQEERFLRNPPETFPGTALVGGHEEEGGQVDDAEVQDEYGRYSNQYNESPFAVF